MKLGLISLGCPKNLVDGEVMLGLAREAGHDITSDAHDAGELERVHFAARNGERAWVDPESVANTWSPERLLAWLGQKRASVAAG